MAIPLSVKKELFALFAKQYREDLSKAIKRGIQEKKERGKNQKKVR